MANSYFLFHCVVRLAIKRIYTIFMAPPHRTRTTTLLSFADQGKLEKILNILLNVETAMMTLTNNLACTMSYTFASCI